MCQAYEGERSFICSLEHNATIAGFKAARAGEPKTSNPFNSKPWSGYEREAWNHGWECSQQPRLLPYALELKIRKTGDYGRLQEIREHFKNTGELPPELEKILAQNWAMV